LDASPDEVTSAVAACAVISGVYPGRGGEYDRQRDCYVITGKDLNRVKIVDFVIQGSDVAGAIHVARALWGKRYERGDAEPGSFLMPIPV